jgi:excisionase family DNA binding protein
MAEASSQDQASDLLTVPEAAALLRLKPSTIRSWTCQRRIPFVKLGRLVRIRRSDAEALVESSVIRATPATARPASAKGRNSHAGSS